jgi:predicted nucleotidyltransferase
MTTLSTLQSKRDVILSIAKECGLEDIRVFGSVAREEDKPDSDIDVLVKRIPGKSMGLKTYAFPAALEEMFGRKIDFVIESTLHRVIRDQVLQEAKPI